MKRLYIVVNNKSKAKHGKIARACTTIGYLFNNYSREKMILLDKFNLMFNNQGVIVVKGGDSFMKHFNKVVMNKEFVGCHKDAGKTQVEENTILAFGLFIEPKLMEDFKLY